MILQAVHGIMYIAFVVCVLVSFVGGDSTVNGMTMADPTSASMASAGTDVSSTTTPVATGNINTTTAAATTSTNSGMTANNTTTSGSNVKQQSIIMPIAIIAGLFIPFLIEYT